MISLDCAISHIREQVAVMEPGDCRDEHEQLAGWLEEFRTLREDNQRMRKENERLRDVMLAAKDVLPYIVSDLWAARDIEDRLREVIQSVEDGEE